MGKLQTKSTVHFGGRKTIVDDWDPDEFIKDLYEQYLQSVQQDKSSKLTKVVFDENSTFESYLQECLKTLKWRKIDLKREWLEDAYDVRIYQNGKMLIEMSESAINKYLEKPFALRLISV